MSVMFKKLKLGPTILIVKKDLFEIVTALRNMVRIANSHHARNTWFAPLR
jgi:hypothetical protein